MKISEIIPNEKNPRYIKSDKFKKLVKSIKDFPEMLSVRPIVIDENNMVLGGNMRLKACIEAGVDDVPVTIVKGFSWNYLKSKKYPFEYKGLRFIRVPFRWSNGL